MLRRLPLGLLALAAAGAAEAREMVEASAPTDLAVTVYRDPFRGEFEAMDPNFLEGFALISETRTVTLPPGDSTVRFTGVAEGMVAVTAIVAGLPGGVIEKNRNAQLLSPAALVDGTLGNRVTITRTDPATGASASEAAIVRTRADGGLVLQTSEGFEAVRCSGLPERLTFEGVPAGLSAAPVFSVDTSSAEGGTHEVTLTYLAAGFDWQAQYVARFAEGGPGGERKLSLFAWLTLANTNGQSFADAELMTVAGTLNVESDYQDLAEPPRAEPLRLTCFPLGSTAAGSPVPRYDGDRGMLEKQVVVTGSRVRRGEAEMMADALYAPAPPAMEAAEEDLGDLKLYRLPERVTVASNGQKQVAFLDRDDVTGELVYELRCSPAPLGDGQGLPITLRTRNDEEHGLGIALPAGQLALFEPSRFGPQLLGEQALRDYGREQEIELEVGTSAQVFGACGIAAQQWDWGEDNRWATVAASLSNANPERVTVRVWLGAPDQWEFQRRPRGTRLKDGQLVFETTLPARGTRELDWRMRPALR